MTYSVSSGTLNLTHLLLLIVSTFDRFHMWVYEASGVVWPSWSLEEHIQLENWWKWSCVNNCLLVIAFSFTYFSRHWTWKVSKNCKHSFNIIDNGRLLIDAGRLKIQHQKWQTKEINSWKSGTGASAIWFIIFLFWISSPAFSTSCR